jgi:2-aminoethylphosphonate-pyruvate transaminase
MTRYSIIAKNHEIVYKEMTKLGFESFILFNEQSKIVNSFLYPKDINFSFERFHNLLLDNGRVLFSRSLTSLEPTFRIGNIGHLTPSDMYNLIDVIKKILKEMDIELPLRKDYFAQE